MKNVIVNFIGKRGGAPLYAYEMTKALSEKDIHPIAIIPDNISNIDDWNSIENCDLIKIPGYSNSYISFIKTIFRIIFVEHKKFKRINKAHKIDYVYIPMIQPLTILINMYFRNTKKIVTIHDPIPHKGATKLLIWLYEKAVKQADKIIVLSEAFVQITSKLYSKKIEDIIVIPHGIFDNYKKVYDPKYVYKYDSNRINFLFFGRITKYKGLDILAKAFSKIEKEFENVTLTVVGNGDFSEYKELYNDITNVTIVNRWIKDEEVYSFFKGENIVTVLPYIEATQSGVIPVAMANNSLVICSDTGGLSEQVVDGETGYLVKPSDVDDLYQLMKKIILGEYDRSVVSNAQRYISGLSWDKLVTKLIELIK